MLDKLTLWGEICSIFEEKNATQNTLRKQGDLLNTYMNAYNENPTIQDADGTTTTFQDRMNQVGSHIGVNNPGQQNTDQSSYMKSYRDQYGDKAFVIDFVDKMIQAAMELRKYVTNDGAVNTRLMYAHNTDQYGNGVKKQLNGVDAGYLMKMKDIIDLLSLSFLYYNPQQTVNGNQVPIDQTNYIKNTPKTYRNVALGALKKKADQANGKNVEYEPNMLDFEELKEYIVNYLTSDKTIMNTQLDGTRWSNKSKTGYKDVYGIQKKQTFYSKNKGLVETDYFKSIADKIFKNVYGIDLEVPESLFTYGNNKLSEDTLVINFTSAHRCPAWNDCLVRNACYARASEHGYKDLFAKNKNVNMMWEGSKYDQRIMDSLKAVIRSYLINYQNVGMLFNVEPTQTKQSKRAENAKRVLNQQSTDNEYSMVSEVNRQAEAKMLEIIESHEGFNHLSEEQLAIMKNPENNLLRAKYIRLNEEGDFIGQWLVDAIDEFAGELKKIGVSVAAYTCRNLNYNGIKNIILNASKSAIGTNDDGTIANTIARRFYAVPEEFYNSLDETYAASSADVKYDSDGNPINAPVKPTLVNENDEWHIIPYPQPVYADESGKQRNESYYYYKCPCGRGKKSKKNDVKTPINTRFNTIDRVAKDMAIANGEIKAADNEKSGINCYDCRMCYQPKSEITNMPIVVYVQVHSTEKDLFDYKKQKDTGYSKGYQQNRTELGLNEEIFNVRDEEEDRETMAIQQITNNAIYSVNEHLSNLGQQMQMEEEKIKKGFKLMLERINGAEF